MNPQINNLGQSIKRILDSIPPGVLLLAAAKTRTLEEVEVAIQSGVTDFGYNYVQEALPIIQAIGNRAKWHMIGHLQQNKVSVAVSNFDMIETVDSWHLAQTLDHHCAKIQKKMPVLVEVNSGRPGPGFNPYRVFKFVATFRLRCRWPTVIQFQSLSGFQVRCNLILTKSGRC